MIKWKKCCITASKWDKFSMLSVYLSLKGVSFDNSGEKNLLEETIPFWF